METTTDLPVRDSKLQAFFVGQLQDIYWAEKKFTKKLLKLEEAATTQQVKSALNYYQAQSVVQLERLREVFLSIDEAAEGKKCPAMAGIMAEGKEMLKTTDEGSAQRDVGIIFTVQKAAHYKIAIYGGLAQLARTLGWEKGKELLGQTLAETKQADLAFSRIAELGPNEQAGHEEAGIPL